MVSTIPSSFPNVITPFAPMGRQPVGQESPDLRNSTLKPLEESAETARRENRRSPDEQTSNSQQADQKAVERELEQRREQEIVQEVRELAARDREVRAHEQAHAAVGGRYAGAPTYEFTRGPDGVSYAVAGEVSIDTSKVPNDPQATIEKAQLIRRAAYAPAEPSSTDRQVAAEAAQMEAEARAELRQQQVEEARKSVAGESEQEDSSAITQSAQSDGISRDSGATKTPSAVASSDSKEPDSVINSVISSAERSVELGRRLIESGAQPDPFPPGQLFSQRA